MQETLYQTADAGFSPSDSGCRRHSIRQRMQEYLHQTGGCRRHFIRQRMQESFHQTADAGDSFRQRMQDSLHQTVDAGYTLSDSECRSISIRQAVAGDTLSLGGCRRLSIRQQRQEYLYQTADAGDYQTANAGDSLSEG